MMMDLEKLMAGMRVLKRVDLTALEKLMAELMVLKRVDLMD